MKKNGYNLLSTIYKACLSPTNSAENLAALLCTSALLCVEVGCDEVLVELFRLVLALQSAATDSALPLTVQNRAAIQNLVANYMNLACQLVAIPALCQHVHQA